jgi:putative membrane protein
MKENRFFSVLWMSAFLVVFAWSGIHPHDYFTWGLEVFPAVAGLGVIIATRKGFPLTPLAYWLILVHSVILMIGGHYTYAEVPLFNWLRDALSLGRNNYDKVGHFAQGFIPAIIAREILIRKSPLKPGKWLSFLVVCVCLAISASYELMEWGVAEATGSASEAFLGTQGYVWDTQSDMAYALAGAIVSLVIFSKTHDRQLEARGFLSGPAA